MTADERKRLMALACQVRMGVIEGTHAAKAGHPGGSLSAADLFTYLYFKEMNIDPENPQWADRDRFVLSKGHTAPGLYAALALRGFFPWEELKTLRHIGSRLQGQLQLLPGAGELTDSDQRTVREMLRGQGTAVKGDRCAADRGAEGLLAQVTAGVKDKGFAHGDRSP